MSSPSSSSVGRTGWSAAWNRRDRWAPPAVFLLLWASGFAVVKIGLRDAEPLTFLALRYALVVAVLLPLRAVIKLPWPATVRAWRQAAVVGAIQFFYFSATYLALRAGLSAGALALIVSMQPILVALIAPRSVGESVSARQWLGLGLGLSGAAVVILGKRHVEATPPLGLLFAALGLCGMTAGVLYEKRAGQGSHALVAALVQCAVGLALTAPLAAVLETGRIHWTPSLLGSLLYLAIGNSLVSIGLLLHMVRSGRVSSVSALLFLVPPLAAVMAWLLVDEPMPLQAWAGLVVGAAGVWVSGSSPQRASAPRWHRMRGARSPRDASAEPGPAPDRPPR